MKLLGVTHCKKVSFSIERVGAGSVPEAEVIATLDSRQHYKFVHDGLQGEPEAFPPDVTTDDPTGTERFSSRAIRIEEFRSPQKVLFSLSIGGSDNVPSGIARIMVRSHAEKLSVITGTDYGAAYIVTLIVAVVVLLVCPVAFLMMQRRLKASNARIAQLQSSVHRAAGTVGGE